VRLLSTVVVAIAVVVIVAAAAVVVHRIVVDQLRRETPLGVVVPHVEPGHLSVRTGPD
jgi:hypothetical protein